MGAYVEECAGPLGILGLVSGVATMADCEVVEESSRPDAQVDYLSTTTRSHDDAAISRRTTDLEGAPLT